MSLLSIADLLTNALRTRASITLPSKTTSCTQGLYKSLSKWPSACRVLARDQLPILATDHHLGPPWLGRSQEERVAARILLQIGLQHERHRLGHAHLILLGVAEAGDLLTSDEIATVGELGVDQGSGPVTDGRDDFGRLVEFTNDVVGDGGVGEIEHGCFTVSRRGFMGQTWVDVER